MTDSGWFASNLVPLFSTHGRIHTYPRILCEVISFVNLFNCLLNDMGICFVAI